MGADPTLRRLASAVVLPGFVGTTAPDWLLRMLDEGLAGVCLFGQNIEHPDQVRDLTAALHGVRPGVLVTADEEGGTVTRLDADAGSPWPGHAALGALDDLTTTQEVARGIAARARSLGVDVVLGPVVDVHSEPDNPVIGERSFGADPVLVGRHAMAFVRGLHAGGVAACAKHFPGHGATRTDSHVTLPELDVDEATYRARDLAPFAAAVAAGVDCVMTAHVVVRSLDAQPATMSAPVLRLLRDELAFTGVVVSDALDMRAIADRVGRAQGAVQALAAGVDLLCVGNPAFPDAYADAEAAEEVVAAVAAGVPGARLEEAAARVAALALPPAVAPLDDHAALAVGSDAATRALSVTGSVRVGSDALVLLAPPETSYAAGRRASALSGLVPTVPVADADDAAALAGAAPQVVIVVEGRSGPVSRRVVASVLTVRPDAVVVHLGLADADGPTPARMLVTHGGGRAAAVAVQRALGLEDHR